MPGSNGLDRVKVLLLVLMPASDLLHAECEILQLLVLKNGFQLGLRIFIVGKSVLVVPIQTLSRLLLHHLDLLPILQLTFLDVKLLFGFRFVMLGFLPLVLDSLDLFH